MAGFNVITEDLMTAVAKLSLVPELKGDHLAVLNEDLKELEIDLVQALGRVAAIQKANRWQIVIRGLDGQLVCAV
jgi:hypothetical protein